LYLQSGIAKAMISHAEIDILVGSANSLGHDNSI